MNTSSINKVKGRTIFLAAFHKREMCEVLICIVAIILYTLYMIWIGPIILYTARGKLTSQRKRGYSESKDNKGDCTIIIFM